MDELKLHYFSSVCRHLSFTRAAQACHVVQSTISKQIAALEEELGVQLFYRDNRSVRLTPAGIRLQNNAMTYTNQYRAINASVHKLMMDFSDRLSVGVGHYETDMLIGPLRSFGEGHPSTELSCLQYTYSNLVALTIRGVLDVSIGTELTAKACRGMTSVDLFTDKWVIAAHQDSEFWTLDEGNRRRLEGQMVITTVNNVYEPVRPYCIANKLNFKAFSFSNTYASQLLMLRSKVGISILPSYLRPFIPDTIRMEDILDPPLTVKFMVTYNPRTFTPSMSDFVECCRSALTTGS